MALINGTKGGRPLYRVRWNHRRENGKRRFDERVFRNRADAIAFEARINPGTTQSTERITLRQLHAEFIVSPTYLGCELRTRNDFDTQWKRRIEPYLGSKRVSAVTPKLLDKWQEWMLHEGQAPTDGGKTWGARACNKATDALSWMIRWGRKRGKCDNRTIDDAPRLDEPPPKPANPYTPAQVVQIADGCMHERDRAMLMVAAFSGLRWSELRGLRWTDLDITDPDTATINLERSIDADGSEKSTKSNKHRVVPILRPGADALLRWQAAAPDTDLVFPNRQGRPISQDWYIDRLPKIRDAAGIHFDPHELRDTYASILIATGIGELELTLWLGHASVETTRRRYAKLFEKRKAARAAQANQLLAAGLL